LLFPEQPLPQHKEQRCFSRGNFLILATNLFAGMAQVDFVFPAKEILGCGPAVLNPFSKQPAKNSHFASVVEKSTVKLAAGIKRRETWQRAVR